MPAAWIASLRLLLAALIFIPFLKRIKPGIGAMLFGTGAIQFGLMYLAYMHSYKYLQSHEVILFTIFTPLYVSMINDLRAGKVNPLNLAAAMLAVGGAGVVLWNNHGGAGSRTGFFFVQAANICFAMGQLLYRGIFRHSKDYMKQFNDQDLISWLYLGGFVILLPLALHDMSVAMPRPDIKQSATIIYLGVVASGIAFFLWNKGCRLVSAGTLAVMNNLKIPTAVLVSLLLFGEKANIPTLLGGSILLGAAIWVAGRGQRIVNCKR